MSDRPTPTRAAPGYRMRDLCEREGISRATGWRWVNKGLLQISRQAPRTGVRVSYPDPSRPSDGDDDEPD